LRAASHALSFSVEAAMASRNREGSERKGAPDPVNEPEPPKLGSAGDLGPVGQQKQEETGLKSKDAISRDRAAADEESPGGK